MPDLHLEAGEEAIPWEQAKVDLRAGGDIRKVIT